MATKLSDYQTFELNQVNDKLSRMDWYSSTDYSLSASVSVIAKRVKRELQYWIVISWWQFGDSEEATGMHSEELDSYDIGRAGLFATAKRCALNFVYLKQQ